MSKMTWVKKGKARRTTLQERHCTKTLRMNPEGTAFDKRTGQSVTA